MKRTKVYKIETNIPFPNKISRYPFDKMAVGDSFLIDKEESVGSVRVLITQYSKKHSGIKFSTRTTNEGLRVWRVA